MRLVRASALAAAACASILALSACTGDASPSGGDGASVTIAVDSFTIGAPVFVAEDQGYFQEQGLAVEPAIFQTGVEGIQALTTGQADFAFGMDFAAVSSVSERLVVLGATSSPEPGFHQFYMDSSLSSPEDLAGQAIGVLPGTAQAYSSQRWLEAYGVEDSVEQVEFPGVYELVGALRGGEIQGGFIFGVGIPEAEGIETITQVGDDSEVLALQGMYLLSTRDYVEANPDTVEQMLTALGAANGYISEDMAGAAEITAAATGGEAAVLQPSLEISNPGLRFTEEHRENLLNIQEFLIDNGEIPAETDIEGSIDLSILEGIDGAEVE
ncbi:ABC transporter substrate-binding protein [Ruania zhangjianzhongii]|uniref:ABC transporter substrate-binding protein n=1 Tax=Ruania zhangjianzhongii TaxID=2603206 RepID=UPI0011CC3E86|nr:ABC transporter substrate-binding protein [Ruania zhangjianzhongii]